MENDTPIVKASPFVVVREIILSEGKYRSFQKNLLEYAPFIAARTDLTGYNSQTGCFRCLLVTTRNRRDGILVNSEGSSYARYAAYVKDKGALDLTSVARDNLDLRSRER